jgi:hypothetical protein
MTNVQEGAHTRETWLEAFYAALREQVPPNLRTGSSGFEFMRYDVLAAAQRADAPQRIVVHTMETNLPTSGAITYNGAAFSYTAESSPSEAAKEILSWLQPNRRAEVFKHGPK